MGKEQNQTTISYLKIVWGKKKSHANELLRKRKQLC